MHYDEGVPRLSAVDPLPPQNDPSPQTRPSAEGLDLSVQDPQQRQAAIEMAFDYRGDVTIHTDEGQSIRGYLYDRRGSGPEAIIRIIPTAGTGRMTIQQARITRVVLDGRDPAAGKSWETWVRLYQQKKTTGQEASLHPEPLDD